MERIKFLFSLYKISFKMKRADRELDAKIKIIDKRRLWVKKDLLSLIINLIRNKNRKFIAWLIKFHTSPMRIAPWRSEGHVLNQNYLIKVITKII
jgi:hypothetical protein